MGGEADCPASSGGRARRAQVAPRCVGARRRAGGTRRLPGRAGRRGGGLSRGDVSGGELPALSPTPLRLPFPGPREREAVAAPPVGEGRSGGGGGRSDADAKVEACGHHFCARKPTPGLEAAAAGFPGP